MKNLINLIFWISALIGLASPPSFGQDRAVVSYKQNANVGEVATSPINIVFPKKDFNMPGQNGNIILIYDDFTPDSIRFAVNAAKELWEKYMPLVNPVNVYVSFEDIEDQISMITDVTYSQFGDFMGYPKSLSNQLKETPLPGADAMIRINSNINWNCSFNAENASGCNAYTVALRSFAFAFGFGCTFQCLDEESHEYDYTFGDPGLFEQLIHRGDAYLADVDIFSPDFHTFVTSGDLKVKGLDGDHNLYCPAPYEPFVSLNYLNDSESLMHYAIGGSNKFMTIDYKTIDILKKIGWDIVRAPDGLEILCADLDENKSMSSYTPHVFSLKEEEGSQISSHQWRYYLKSKQGEYVLTSSSAEQSIQIPKVVSTDNLYINVAGLLEGRIECDYIVGNDTLKAKPLNFTLGLKPVIHSIDNFNRIETSDESFKLTFNISYAGADHVTVEVEEEYSSYLRAYHYNEPVVAHASTGNINALFYSWVTIVATNEYGTTMQTIEIEPTVCAIKAGNEATQIDIENGSTTRMIEVYSIDGVLKYQGLEEDFVQSRLPHGIYIRKITSQSGKTMVSKFKI